MLITSFSWWVTFGVFLFIGLVIDYRLHRIRKESAKTNELLEKLVAHANPSGK